MKYKTFESFVNQSYVYSENYEYGNIEGIVHNDITKVKNWFKRRKLNFKEYKEYIKLPIAFANNLYVYYEYRGKGYGNVLHDEFEDFCHQHGAKGIIMESDAGEEQLEGFNLDDWYIRIGFKIIGDSYGNKIMYKEL